MPGTTYVKLYLDGLCIDVNPKNKLSNISDPADPRHLPRAADQLEPARRLGPDTTIDPVGRDTNGGTYNFFLQAVLNNELPASNVNALTADGLVVNAVKQDPNAIGYDGLAWQGKGQKALKVNGVPAKPRRSASSRSSTRSRATSSSSCRPTAREHPAAREVRRLGARATRSPVK